MADFITTKANGDSLDASEWNQLEEIDNAIDSSGLTLTTAQKDQLKISMARYASGANFYTDGGSANAYVLTSISHGGGKSFAPAGAGAVNYFNGMSVRFRPANNNSGASTVNVSGFGSKDIRKSNGTSALTGGELTTATDVILRYDSTNSCFIIQEYAKATTTNQGVSYLNNQITIANNVASPNDVVDFGAGTFITSAGNQIYLPAITKKIQSSGAWTAGTGQNGLDSGARTANTFYRSYLIQNNSTLAYDILFSTSATSPTVPSGYTNLGIIDYAFIRVNGSNNIATAKWDVNNKRLVLGSGQAIQIFSGVATGSGNTTVMNTTEKLEFLIRLSLSTASAGGSDISVYGSEHDGNDGYDVAQATTNNGFSVSIGPVPIYTSDGKIYWKNFSTAGGVTNQTCKIKSIKIRS